MFEFILGVGVGIWIGTTYNCNHYIEMILYTIKNTKNHNETKNM
jgi:hypothetical protein